MYAQEEAFKKSADFALSTSTVLSGVCLVSGVVLSNTVCGPELSEWNIVNGVLCGALAASLHFALKSCPKVLQNAFRLSRREMSPRELMSEGLLVTAVSAGIVAIPALLAFWSVSGLFSMTIGLCAESAPLFYCVTLAAMLAQIAAIANVAKINMEAAGYNVRNIECAVHECASKTKEVAMDIGRKGHEAALMASDRAIPVLHATVEKGKHLFESRPKYMTVECKMFLIFLFVTEFEQNFQIGLGLRVVLFYAIEFWTETKYSTNAADLHSCLGQGEPTQALSPKAGAN